MRIRYVTKKFRASTLAVVEQANAICEPYAAGGLSLTLRQLYYQFVSRGFLDQSGWYVDPVEGTNNKRNYDRLKGIISDARMAGLFDWDYIIDRTRNLASNPHWKSPAELVAVAAEQYRTDLWAPQKRRVEVWIEKDAAIGVIERVCTLNDVPYFSCRGYTSASEMWSAATRIGEYLRNGEQTLILHIGDHDPSGLDMTRDIKDRLRLFITRDWVNQYGLPYGNTRGFIRQHQRDFMREAGSAIGDSEAPWQVRRIALTIDQIEQYEPPPNYAKQSDIRYQAYVEETGLTESWELDALDPAVMEQLIQDEIEAFRDDEALAQAELAQERDRQVLTNISNRWDDVRESYGSAS
jgi:hypothetical protein